MWVGKQADLYQCDGDRGVTPGLELAAINRQGGDALDTFCPLTGLLMIGELASKGEKRAVILVIGRAHQPAIKFEAWTRASRWHAIFVGWQQVLEFFTR